MQFVRYGFLSGVALGVDVGLLFVLHTLAGVHYVVAASISFLAGMVVVYLGSISWVFSERSVTDQKQEVLIFLAIGLSGLVLNGLLISLLVEIAHFPVYVAKGCVVIFVFLFNFFMRKWLLFMRKPTAAERE